MKLFSALNTKVEKLEGNLFPDTAANQTASTSPSDDSSDHILLRIHNKLDAMIEKTSKVEVKEEQLEADEEEATKRKKQSKQHSC